MATINGVEWSVNPTAELHPYADASTSGWKNRVAGVKDWTASFREISRGSPALSAGQSLATISFIEFSTYVWTGAARVQGVAVAADPNTGAPSEYIYTIEGNGALTEAAGSGGPSSTSPNAKVVYT